jgi:cell division protein ZapD
MSRKNTIYEYPLSERIRTLLRIEHLFNQLDHYIHGRSVWDSRIAVNTLFDILDIFSRSDIKNEVIKESDRALVKLKTLAENPHIDTGRLDTILKAIERTNSNLHSLSGQPGSSLKDIPLLYAIRQRSTIPGGTCDFDLPVYHQWLEQSMESRQQQLLLWFHELEPIQQSIELILKLLRNSAEFNSREAENGLYQEALDNNMAYQLLRVAVAHDSCYFSEISGSKHRFTIRFLEHKAKGNHQASETISFKIAKCLI